MFPTGENARTIYLYKNGNEFPIEIKIIENPNEIFIPNNDICDSNRFVGSDLFECLVQLRLFLEAKSIFVLCNGSRIDVYPSRLIRQMTNGRMAYILKSNTPTSSEFLVDIFDKADANKVGTVKEQIEFYKNWVQE